MNPFNHRSIHSIRVPAALPCRSPLEPSFLYAYEQCTGRLARYWPFMDSMAASPDSKLSKEMKPKPREAPVSGSVITWRHAHGDGGDGAGKK